MPRMTGLVSALLAVALMAGPAMAQSIPSDALSVIAGIGNHDFARSSREANDASSVQVIRLSSLMTSAGDASRLRDAEAIHGGEIADLQFQLSFNPAAQIAIRNAGLTLDRIVSIHVDGHGAAIVFADDL